MTTARLMLRAHTHRISGQAWDTTRFVKGGAILLVGAALLLADIGQLLATQ